MGNVAEIEIEVNAAESGIMTASDAPVKVKRGAEDSNESSSKRMRDDARKLKDQLTVKYGTQQPGNQSAADRSRPLSETLDINKIAEIKKKILLNRQARLKISGDKGERGADGSRDAGTNRTKEIISRDQQQRVRTAVSQSNGKQARKDGRCVKPVPSQGAFRAGSGMPPAPAPAPARRRRRRYNRYEQELLTRNQREFEGFKIDTTGTFLSKDAILPKALMKYSKTNT